ncbi:MAG: hypothetical protein R2750_12620 [Bacteroidales bacterium]
MKNSILMILAFGLMVSFAHAQNLSVQIKGLPPADVYLADFYGDKNAILDTAVPDTGGVFSFAMKGSYHAGMYRIFLSKEVYFDIVYNRENIRIKTDYNYLYDSLEVIESTENKLYYGFLRAMNQYRRKFDLLGPPNDYYPKSDSFYQLIREQYVLIQEEIQAYIDGLIAEYPDAWTTKIVKRKRPLFYDLGLGEMEKRDYTVEHYFDHFDFTDVDLIRSNVYTTSAIEYMSLYSNPDLTSGPVTGSIHQSGG